VKSGNAICRSDFSDMGISLTVQKDFTLPELPALSTLLSCSRLDSGVSLDRKHGSMPTRSKLVDIAEICGSYKFTAAYEDGVVERGEKHVYESVPLERYCKNQGYTHSFRQRKHHLSPQPRVGPTKAQLDRR